ncbi:MAG: divalent-cation tolerance protein CutA [Desulfomicrobium sp.]|jgi:periplasmic divalent cation tolerance protein|nr:divalent-cation tolerance protein CutA [Desulfomicrobium sp.]NLV95882.1 divalent-cation tolerance protein CutA [Desulfovibrionales bacterium]
MDQIMVYMTAPDLKCARTISQALVKERLVACVNILPHMESIYWWNESIHNESEVVILAKSMHALFPALQDTVLALHPYEVPCIVAWDMANGHPPFLQWIAAQVLPWSQTLQKG